MNPSHRYGTIKIEEEEESEEIFSIWDRHLVMVSLQFKKRLTTIEWNQFNWCDAADAANWGIGLLLLLLLLQVHFPAAAVVADWCAAMIEGLRVSIVWRPSCRDEILGQWRYSPSQTTTKSSAPMPVSSHFLLLLLHQLLLFPSIK